MSAEVSYIVGPALGITAVLALPAQAALWLVEPAELGVVAALAARGETVWFALANAVWCLASLVGHGSAIMVGAAIAQPLTGLLIDRASPIVANLAAVGITALVATFAAQFGGTTSLRRAP